ncbi:MAG: VOC family protein [Pseudomonadota bacterium]
MEAAGVEITTKPHKAFWGGYSGYFADPEGNAWEVAYNPFWTFDEAGRVVLPNKEDA